jgi:uncharacterized glyoxalase superfamily protein PhnB
VPSVESAERQDYAGSDADLAGDRISREVNNVNNRSAPKSAIVPVLIYEDVGKAIEWLRGAFGFTERLHAGEPSGKIGHAQISFGDGDVMLGSQRPGFRPPRPNEVSHMVHVKVDDVDQHFAQATKFGAKIVNPLSSHPYGERQYTAQDIGGHWWTFSQTIADIDPATWGGITPARRSPIK